VATMLSTEVPPLSGTAISKLPSGAAVVAWSVVREFASMFVAATVMALPGSEVPST
jgi:hypothetical protein